MKSLRWPTVNSLVMAAALLGTALPGLAAAQGITRVNARIELQGVPALAAHLRQGLPGHIARALADHPVQGYPAGARLVVRVHGIFLASGGSGSSFGGFGGMSMPDSIEGGVDVVDARGRILYSRPLTAHHPVTGNVHTAPLHEPLRVNNLMKSLSYWAVRSATP